MILTKYHLLQDLYFLVSGIIVDFYLELFEYTTFGIPTPNALYCIKWTKEKFWPDNLNISKSPEFYI